MTREETKVKTFDVLHFVADNAGLSTFEAIEKAYNMGVSEQEPKTVLYIGDGYADGYMVYDMAECPNCGYEYEESDKDWGLPFCPNCGQSLNWESEDKE